MPSAAAWWAFSRLVSVRSLFSADRAMIPSPLSHSFAPLPLVPPGAAVTPVAPLATAATARPAALVASSGTLLSVPLAATVTALLPTLGQSLPFASTESATTSDPNVSPARSATAVHSHTQSVVPASAADKQSISPASSSASSDSSASSASSRLSVPSADDVLSASSSSSSGSSSLNSSDTSNVSTVSSFAVTAGSSYSATAAADRQRAHVAESAYQQLLANLRALTEHVAAAQLASGVPDVVKKGLEETLERAKKGWKKIKAERKKRRKRKHAMKERALKQEGEQLMQQAAAAAAVASTAAAHPSRLATVAPPVASAAPAVVVGGGSNILQVLSSVKEDGGRKRRQLSDSTAADTMADEDADEDEDGDEEDEAAGEVDTHDVSPPLAFATMPRLAVMSLTSPVPVPPAVAGSASQPSAASPSAVPPATPAAYQPSVDGAVTDAQAPVVMSCSKFPIAVLNVPVQRQYTMTRKDSKRMKRADKEALVNVTVRIMGTPDRQHIYFVAKDVCQLICLRKGSVAKAIHDFSATEKARMPVLCQRSSGSGCTQVLTVLTMAGVQRLMTSSRQPIARSVLQWLSERVGEIQAGQMPSTAFDPNTVTQSTDSSHPQHTSRPTAAAAAAAADSDN